MQAADLPWWWPREGGRMAAFDGTTGRLQFELFVLAFTVTQVVVSASGSQPPQPSVLRHVKFA